MEDIGVYEDIATRTGGDIYIGGGETRAMQFLLNAAQKMRAQYPNIKLHIHSGDIADAEYVTEWLGIVLCRVCGQQDVSMPPFDAGAAPVAQFRWFIQKAARQAGAIRRAILLGRVSKALFAEKAWEGLDSAETFLGSFLSENVYRERRRMR